MSRGMEAVRAVHRTFADGGLDREPHVRRIGDGRLLGPEVSLDAPAPLLAVLGH